MFDKAEKCSALASPRLSGAVQVFVSILCRLRRKIKKCIYTFELDLAPRVLYKHIWKLNTLVRSDSILLVFLMWEIRGRGSCFNLKGSEWK